MKWLMAFALLLYIPAAEISAQEVSESAVASATSLSAASRAPGPQPRQQTINDDDVRGTWEMGLGYTFVHFQSSLFNASMNGLNTSVSYYLRDHFALESNVTAAFSEDARYLFYGGGGEGRQSKTQLQTFVAAPVGGGHIFSRRWARHN